MEFVSDSAGTSSGFNITATEHTAGCGGVLHGMVCLLPLQFANATFRYCSPKILVPVLTDDLCPGRRDPVPPGGGLHQVPRLHRVHLGAEDRPRLPHRGASPHHWLSTPTQVTFEGRFDIELSTDCTEDYVELQGWDDGSQRWVTSGARQCGRQLPLPLASPTGHSRIVFRSNRVGGLGGDHCFQDTTGDGFTLRWGVGCGGEFTSAYGHLVSPGYPDKVRSSPTTPPPVRQRINLHLDHLPSRCPLHCCKLCRSFQPGVR